MERYFPGDYRLIHPGADLLHRPGADDDGVPEIVFSAEEERGALRLFLRALRRLSVELDWRATIWLRDPATAPAVSLPRRLRDRVELAGPADGSEAQHLARAQIAVAASAGTAPAPQMVLRALAGGAVPVAARLPQYEEVLRDGELGLLFEPRDALTLAGQLERLISDPGCASELRGPDRARASRARVVARGRLASRSYTRRSPHGATRRTAGPTCASDWPSATSSTWTSTCTPTTRPTARRSVDTLLETRPSGSGSGRSRSPTTTRCRAPSRRASAPTGSR